MLVNFNVHNHTKGIVSPEDTPEQVKMIEEYGPLFKNIANGVYLGFSEHYVEPTRENNRQWNMYKWFILRDLGVFIHEDTYLSWGHQENEYEIDSLYGTCDTVEQILTRYKKLFDNYGTRCAVTFQPMYSIRNPDFKWHKHGAYHGDHQEDYWHLDRWLCYNILFASTYWDEYFDRTSETYVDDVMESAREFDKEFAEFDIETLVEK